MRRFSILPLILFACLVATPLRLTAQQPLHYNVVDLGTLGGSYSFAEGISNTGWVEGYATLSGDQVYRAFVWRKGAMTGIGTFGGPDSWPGWSHPSGSGGATGAAETTLQDPLNDYWCFVDVTCVPFLWQNGVLTQLPTLGGYNGQSHGMNSWGEVVGFVENTTLDVSCENLGYLIQENEAVLWKNGRIYELPRTRATIPAAPAGSTTGARRLAGHISIAQILRMHCSGKTAGPLTSVPSAAC